MGNETSSDKPIPSLFPEHGKERALLLIVSGPAGSGKTTLCERMLAEIPQVERVITSTTRSPRSGEEHGRDYYFFPMEEFIRRRDAGEFYEHALVHGRYYGTLKSEIDDKLKARRDLLLNIDVQGAASFRQAAKGNAALAASLVTVFIQPESLDQLHGRLGGRGSDDEKEIARRLKTAEQELLQAPVYDHIIVSGTRDEDYRALLEIYRREKGKTEGVGF